MNRFRVIALILLIHLFPFFHKQAYPQARAVDVVFCLDLSGSTNGLIDDLRERIWDIAYVFRSVSPEPNLRIGIVAYSRPSYGKATGYSKVISPLTSDLDQLSYDLFTIKPYIEKGDQLVGAAIQLTVKSMNWSRDPGAVKMIFLVGNGGVSLGPVDFRAACDEAVLRQITIHPVFCTKANKSRELSGWLEIARISGVTVKEIIIRKRFPDLPVSPDLPALRAANDRLLATTLYYGESGYNRHKMQREADAASIKGGPVNYESRICYKMKFGGNHSDWDLVDYYHAQNRLPEFDRNTLAGGLNMSTDQHLVMTATKLMQLRKKELAEINSLLPGDRLTYLKARTAGKELDDIEIFEHVVCESYLKMLETKGFSIR